MQPLVALVDSADPSCEARGAAGLAALCAACGECASDALRYGAVLALQRACTRGAALSRALFPAVGGAPASDSGAAAPAATAVAGVRAVCTPPCAGDSDAREYFERSIAYLDPEREGAVVPADWARLQAGIVLALVETLCRAESRGDAAGQLCQAPGGLVPLLLLACSPSACARPVALRAVAELARAGGAVGERVGSEFLDAGGDRVLVELLKRDAGPGAEDEAKRAALECLLHVSRASARFRGRIGCSDAIGWVGRIATRDQPIGLGTAAAATAAVAQEVLGVFSQGDAGLFRTMRSGSQEAQERAAVAAWHLSAHNPEMRKSLT